MSADLQSQCALNISDETLSALRDDLLAPNEVERIETHATTCAVCRDRLAGFEHVGAALIGQRLNGPTPRLWDDVRTAISAGERRGALNPFAWILPTRLSRPQSSGGGRAGRRVADGAALRSAAARRSSGARGGRHTPPADGDWPRNVGATFRR